MSLRPVLLRTYNDAISPIDRGTRLGPYEVVSRIGAGGMGVVWQARDTRLDRSVAIKVLPPEFAASAQLRLRFEREAKAISSLNHPHICTLFDVGEGYLVMELLEGESLADRLRKGPLPLDQVLRYGMQVAQALDAAHRQGIVHRDLKPGNVMITKSGAKLLDFGLAKGGLFASPSSGASFVPASEATAHKPLTEEGMILGTFQYMAPEQLEGTEADARTDIFALGALLYEMATGRRAFQGQSKTSLIAAIVSSEPAPISSVAPMSPPALDHIVSKCLAKDPEDRWQSARDVASELQWIGNASSPSGISAVPSARRRYRERVAWAVAAVAALATIAAATMMVKASRKPAQVVRVSIAPPKGTSFDFTGRGVGSLALSPDGRHLVFEVEEPGRNSLWIRSFATGEAKKIGEHGAYPFWSPDSRFVAFFAAGKLWKADISGTPPVVICDAADGRGGSWNREGTIVFAPDTHSGIFQVSASGGTPRLVTKLDPASESTHRWPWFLADGRQFLFLATRGSGVAARGMVWIASLDSPERKALVPSNTNAMAAAGHLLFVRDGALLAQRLDARAGSLTGEPVPIASSIAVNLSTWDAAFTVSESGSLAYHSGTGIRMGIVTIYDMQGTVVHRIDEPAPYAAWALSFSPDAKRLAVEIGDEKGENDDLWILEPARGIRTRLTFDPAGDYVPSWSPDGARLAFSRAEPGKHWYVVVKNADGTGDEKVVFASPDETAWVTSWSPDGRLLACSTQGSTGKRNVVIVPLDGSAPRPLLTAPYNEFNPAFSPDGKWLSYVSDESGHAELYVVSWPEGRGKRQVSTSELGTRQLGYWSGDRLLYVAADGLLTGVRVRPHGGSLDVEKPRPLFELKTAVAFGVSGDGSRIAAVFPFEKSATRSPDLVELILNWPAAIASPAK